MTSLGNSFLPNIVNAFPMKAGFRDSLDLTTGEAKASAEQVTQGTKETPGTLRQGYDACATSHVFLDKGDTISPQDFGLPCCTLP